ncbi:hypothetical protein [Roseomonas chloroacetimidivorans]|uniref:hypothetical protein n=1 Tax=Roseomonas chloroacetimidivorans TaxID=1766656 RepID=UPI003C7700C8
MGEKTHLSLGFVQLASDTTTEGREVFRIEWSFSGHRVRKEAARLALAAVDGKAVPMCSGCVYARPSDHWTVRGLLGGQIINSPLAWRHAQCLHPSAVTGSAHLLGHGVEPDARSAKSLRDRGEACGPEGKHYVAADPLPWRRPRQVLPALLAVGPVTATLYLTTYDRGIWGMVPLALFMGFGLWHLGRRI